MEHEHNHIHANHHDHECEHEHSADVHSEHCACGCGAEHSDHFEQTKKATIIKLVIAAVFFAAGYIIEELASLPEYVSALCFAVSYLAVGFGVVKEALEDMIHGRFFTETFLMSVASLGAVALKEYSEGCAVMLLYSAGEFIQDAVLYKNRTRLRALAKEHGFEYAHSNSDTERFISKFAKIYSPVICALALAIILIPPLALHAEWKSWVYRGLSVLVIGCPCAIVISVPLAFSCAIGACTKRGIFIHCSDALERLYKNRREGEKEIIVPEDDRGGMRFARHAAKKAVSIAKLNITATLLIKGAVLVLVVFMNREIPMWLAEFSDVGIALLAVLNSLRALRVKE
jgi:cation transport ATPase